jgi:hypothetical protein
MSEFLGCWVLYSTCHPPDALAKYQALRGELPPGPQSSWKVCTQLELEGSLLACKQPDTHDSGKYAVWQPGASEKGAGAAFIAGTV